MKLECREQTPICRRWRRLRHASGLQRLNALKQTSNGILQCNSWRAQGRNSSDSGKSSTLCEPAWRLCKKSHLAQPRKPPAYVCSRPSKVPPPPPPPRGGTILHKSSSGIAHKRLSRCELPLPVLESRQTLVNIARLLAVLSFQRALVHVYHENKIKMRLFWF